jgi:signal transduction histidine kinase
MDNTDLNEHPASGRSSAKGADWAGVRHDIRNSLNNIRLAALLLQRQHAGREPTEQLLHEINTSVDAIVARLDDCDPR